MHVEIWSDIACPWCYVGKRRFEAALAAYEHRDEVQVTWRSFELDPSAPREREHDGATHLAEKYGTSRERSLAGIRRVSKPGLRVYAKAPELPRVLGGLGVAIISTSAGLRTDKQCQKQGVGGEVLAYVW